VGAGGFRFSNIPFLFFVEKANRKTKNQQVVKNTSLLLVMSLCLVACATTTRMANKAIRRGLIGQDENTVQARLGLPAEEVLYDNGEKDLIYEYYNRVYEPPRNIKATSFRMGDNGKRNGLDPVDVWNTLTYNPRDADFDIYTHYLEIYLDAEGTCIGLEHNLTKEQLKILLDQFEHYQAKDK